MGGDRGGAHVLRWGRNTYQYPPAERDPAAAAAAAEALRERLGVLDGHLAPPRRWLVGDGFSVADCNLAGVLYAGWANGFDFAAFPRAKAWLDACLERPAARRARALREG